MAITDVAWARDHHRRSILQLEIDGHPAHIPSGQREEMCRAIRADAWRPGPRPLPA